MISLTASMDPNHVRLRGGRRLGHRGSFLPISAELLDWRVSLDKRAPRGDKRAGMPRDQFEYEIILNPDGAFFL